MTVQQMIEKLMTVNNRQADVMLSTMYGVLDIKDFQICGHDGTDHVAVLVSEDSNGIMNHKDSGVTISDIELAD